MLDATGADDKQRRNLDCHMYRSNKEQTFVKKSPKLQVELHGHENWWECRRGTDLSDATGADDKQRRNLDCHMYRSNKKQKYVKNRQNYRSSSMVMKIGGNVVGGCSCRMRQVPMTSNVEIWIVICIGRIRNKNR